MTIPNTVAARLAELDALIDPVRAEIEVDQAEILRLEGLIQEARVRIDGAEGYLKGIKAERALIQFVVGAYTEIGRLPAQPAAPEEPQPLPAELPASLDDDAAVAAYIAERGAHTVMSPEQVAQFLRDSGEHCRLIGSMGAPNKKVEAGKVNNHAYLNGRKVELAEIYALANEIRKLAELPPVAMQ